MFRDGNKMMSEMRGCYSAKRRSRGRMPSARRDVFSVQGTKNRKRSGIILFVVLVMVVLLALLAAAFGFLVRANLRQIEAHHYAFQARMAAESGIQRSVLALRSSRGNVDSWFNDPAAYRGFVVYGQQEGFELNPALKQPVDATSFDPKAPEAWRYSLIAPNTDAPGAVRYGITDEGARLNLNTATQDQLLRLFRAVVPSSIDNAVDVEALVDCLLDWRSAGTAPRPKGAKDEYYLSLTPGYRCKGAPFSTIEELLLVKGFTGWIVFGEDYNQNGLLDPNENDDDATFPPDNGDGNLFRGVSAYLTLWSREMNMSGDGRPKINLNLRDAQKLQDLLSAEFDADIVSYVMQVRGSGRPFNSVMNLFPAPPPPEQPEEEAVEEEPPATTQPEGSEDGEQTSQPASETDNGKTADSTDGATDPSRSFGRSGNRAGGRGARGATSRPSGGAGKLPVYQNLTSEPPPGTLDKLPQILDRLTVNPTPMIQGRININTAPREVLLTLDGLSEEDVNAIVVARAELKSDEKATPAWLLTKANLDLYKYRRIFDGITTTGSVFRAEAVGYADHVGAIARVNTVFEMRGPIPQVLYTRNLSPLGPSYNPYGEERRGGAIEISR